MGYTRSFPALAVAGLIAWAGAQTPPRPWDLVLTERQRTAVQGGRIVLVTRDAKTRNLTPQFADAADPSVSFDGTHILFAAKTKAAGRWAIYEMDADGSNARQITHETADCRSPIYQSRIFYLDDPGPMAQIAYASGGAIYSARMDGSGVRRLTYNPAGAADPAMLPDGRMLFSAPLAQRAELMATNIDGTDYATFSGKQGTHGKTMACVTTARLVVFVEPKAADGAGSLAVIDLRRNLHSYRPLALAPGYLYYSPSPLPDGSVLVSRRAAAGGAFSVVRLDPATGESEPVFAAPGMNVLQAQALTPRAAPDGRSSVVDEKQPWAKLYCLNVYETDIEAKSWPKGTVKRVRVIEASQPKRFIGEVALDDDGSFHLQVPSNVPMQIQALDENGMALRSSAWMWAKNKEQRGCIGCHEDGERTPENVMAVALTHPASNLMLPAERRRTVGFERDIAPIFRERCAAAACHGSAAQPKLTHAALARYITPGAARTSPLIWAVFGRNTSRAWDRKPTTVAPKRMPPAGSAPLTDAEKRAIVEWIDLGGQR